MALHYIPLIRYICNYFSGLPTASKAIRYELDKGKLQIINDEARRYTRNDSLIYMPLFDANYMKALCKTCGLKLDTDKLTKEMTDTELYSTWKGFMSELNDEVIKFTMGEFYGAIKRKKEGKPYDISNLPSTTIPESPQDRDPLVREYMRLQRSESGFVEQEFPRGSGNGVERELVNDISEDDIDELIESIADEPTAEVVREQYNWYTEYVRRLEQNYGIRLGSTRTTVIMDDTND